MNTQESLRERLEHMLRGADAQLVSQQAARQERMTPIQARMKRFDSLARSWIEEIILPDLQTLAQLFPNSTPPVDFGRAHRASVTFARNDEFPAHARADVSITHDPNLVNARVVFSPTIIPILMNYQPESSVEIGLDEPDTARLRTFEDGVAQFVSDYLRVRDPDSRYQQDNLVTDPVCGMRFRRMDAAASVEREGTTYFFCVTECRDRFLLDPEGYSGRATVRP